MERVTEIQETSRGVWGEIWYRLDWLIFGVMICVLLAFIPVVGWILASGVFLAVLLKTFGFREKKRTGECPVCAYRLHLEPRTKAIDCPSCQWPITIRKKFMVVVDDDERYDG